MTTNNAVNTGLSGATGTGNFVGSTSPSITTPKITTSINDVNGNTSLSIAAAASAVNYILVENAATTAAVGIEAAGSDSDIILSVSGKGIAFAQTKGKANAGTNSPGYIGEVISSVIPSASAVSLSSGTAADVTNISLTAGDWDIYGNVWITSNGQTLEVAECWGSITSATLPDVSLMNGIYTTTSVTLFTFDGRSIPGFRLNISSTTTVYLSARSVFGSGTVTACGGIYARRSG